MTDLLATMHLQHTNLGGCYSHDNWLASSNHSFQSINPTSGTPLASVTAVSKDDYETILSASMAQFRTWRKVPAPKRGEVIRQLGNLLRQHKDLLGSLVALEMGKSKQEGDGEVQEMIDIADFAVGQSRMLYGKTMHSEREQHRMYEQWHPLGPVGIISSFNFPVAVWAWNAFIAAICGNTVVWKPSHKTPLCAIYVQQLCNDIMQKNHCEGLFSLMVTEDHELASTFVDDERIPLISFTGSTRIGRQVGERVAKRFGKSILELGGNNAIIVDESADVSLALPAVVFGAVGTAGQRCTSTRRLFLQSSIYDKFITSLTAAYKQITIGDPLDSQNLMGPLIDAQAVESYLNAVANVQEQGGEVLVGGNAIEGAGFFVEPCIIKADNHWDIVQCETFAPILYVMSYDSFDDVLQQHNQVKQGLSSALFTTNLKHAERFLSGVGSDCGIANINIGTSGAEIGGAFGGEKETGGGRESGSDAWKAYMRRQTNTINWGDNLPLAQGIEFNL